MQLQTVRGTHDILDNDALLFEYIRNKALHLSSLYGFKKIDTPIFEYSEVFKRAVGETSDIVSKETYDLLDKGNEKLTLRPEGTAACVRSLISNSLTQNMPIRWCYFGAMFRYERPQKGRLRQFHQFGIEEFGSLNHKTDAQIIQLAKDFLDSLEIKSLIQINTLGDNESRLKYKEILQNYFLKYEKDLSEDSKNRLYKNPLRILDSKDINDKKIVYDAPKIINNLNTESKNFFDNVLKTLDSLNIKYQVNENIVRGLDYYSHTTFEFINDNLGSQNTILAGGRYNDLCKTMGAKNDIPAIGWACGIERLMLLISEQFNKQIDERCLLDCAIIPLDDCSNEELKIANEIRKNNKSCIIINKKNLANSFKEAQRLKVRFAIILGQDEIISKKLSIKDLSLNKDNTNKQFKLSLEDFLKTCF